MSKKNRRGRTSSREGSRIIPRIRQAFQEPYARTVMGVALMLAAVYILVAMTSFFFCGGVDQSLVDNALGKVITNPEVTAANHTGKLGAWLSDLLINRWFGIPSFILVYLLLLCGIRTAGIRIRHFGRRLFIGFCIILWGSLLFGFVSESVSTLLGLENGYVFPGGGHGHFLSLWLNALIGRIGTILLLVFTFILILFFGFQTTFYRCVDWCRACIRRRKEKAKAALEARILASRTEAEAGEEETGEGPEEERSGDGETGADQAADGGDIHIPGEGDEAVPPSCTETPDEDQGGTPAAGAPDAAGPGNCGGEAGEEEILRPAGEGDPSEGDIQLTVSNKEKEETVESNMPLEDYDPTLELSRYRYPTLDLLTEHTSGNPKVSQEELEKNKRRIVDTLRNYNIEIVRIKATIGPTITLYEIVPAPGIKISRIRNLEDDIALSLSALGIRIIAPIPGAGTVGIEVPNEHPEVVSMRGVIASRKFQESKYALPVALGRTISNETYTFDLTKMPHLLVAGATGQGKSVGLNAIITSLLYKKHPSQLKFVMVDPKKVELSIYSVIEKHFLAKLPNEEEAIITETSKVVNTLNSLCIEMDNRYDLLKSAQVRNIKEYNEKFIKRHLNPENGHRYLPYIVVVVDEFADLIMTAGKEVETPIARIAQLARAVGIHMIIATQRPSTNIITGVIKANFPARIAFKVASMIDSRTILDAPGANQLIGRGDMLISVGSEMTRVQCAFVDTPEVDAITEFIAGQQGYPSAFALPEYVPESDESGNADYENGIRDSLFEEAAQLVVSSQQGSTSFLQRRFSIGYTRAGRLMDQLEKAGIVGPFEGSKARQVLVQDMYSLEQILNNL